VDDASRFVAGAHFRSRVWRLLVAAVLLLGLGALPSGAQDPTTTVTPTTVESTTTPPTTVDPSSSVSDTSAPPGSDTTVPPPAAPTTLSEEDRQAKAAAASKLNAAVAADSEIAAGLRAVNESAQATQSKVDRAQQSLEAARQAMETAAAELEASSAQQVVVEEQLLSKAVEGFKSGQEDPPSVFFTDRSMNQTIRQTQLLHQANKGTAELLEELRTLKEDQRVAQAEAGQAAQDAEALQTELSAELAILQEQQGVQLRLKREAESRISKWESALTAYAAEDQQIQTLIADSSATTVAVAAPRAPSAYGMQWPVEGPLTSGFGYRVHPVYGTRKLHSGLDISGPQGTPIASAGQGQVIFAGWRGGYGNTVIVDHGEGVTTLYAHMSQISVSDGASVERGDGLGLVGSTGTATGNHLHLEVRVNGEATDPRPYLP
jgi:murein DD-endopeptidase MepM/ murein hydrolase activator NlpD